MARCWFSPLQYDQYGIDLRVIAQLLPEESTTTPIDLRVISNLDGTYTALFTAVKSGSYQLPISVSQSGEMLEIVGSPYSIVVRPGPASLEYLETFLIGDLGDAASNEIHAGALSRTATRDASSLC